MPLLHRADRPAVVHLRGNETRQEIAATIDQAWADGYDAILFRNYITADGRAVDNLVVRSPEQLRSRFAAFDPAKIASPDLLADAAGAALVPAFGAAHRAGQDRQ